MPQSRRPKAPLRAALAGSLLIASIVASTPPAFAQTERARLFANPPVAVLKGGVRGATPLALGAGSQRAPGETFLDLDIRYVDGTIYDPASGRYDKVRLRSYVDPATGEAKYPFIAPTIEIVPGDTIRMSLFNNLPREPGCEDVPSPNTPHCFNTTNMHTHGLWISPTGNSDNVLLAIQPGVRFEYEYNVPPDHPAGTFWYHPHKHGSTAIQVSSGMGGALVIRGSRPPTPDVNGDVDTLLRNPDGSAYPERVVVLQQIQYACYNADGTIKTDPKTGVYVCAPDDIGEIRNYDVFGPGSWPASGRYTTINGEVLPDFTGAQAGRIERWRNIHAGVRDTIRLAFRKMSADAPSLARFTTPAEQDAWIAKYCPGNPLTQVAIAADGLTRSRGIAQTETVLQPGYREDLLMVFPEAGNYCVIDEDAPANADVNSPAPSRKLLGRVVVGTGPAVADAKSYVQQALIASAQQFMPASVKDKVIADLKADIGLQSFVPHRTVADAEVTGKQDLVFKIDTSGPTVLFEINGEPYQPDRIDRVLVLGGVDEWTLTADTNPAAGHPFHIHVNPFQVVRILDPAGNDVSVSGEPDDPQYANLKGVWKDTLFVKPGYKVVVRTRYQRYIGEFVLHCHILDHEDQGMMQNVSIVLPDGNGGAAPKAHGAGHGGASKAVVSPVNAGTPATPAKNQAPAGKAHGAH